MGQHWARDRGRRWCSTPDSPCGVGKRGLRAKVQGTALAVDSGTVTPIRLFMLQLPFPPELLLLQKMDRDAEGPGRSTGRG